MLLSGFACPTLREQVHHVLGAERYWLEVLRGQLVLFNDLAAWPDLEAPARMREQVAEVTVGYLRRAGYSTLYAPRSVSVYGGRDESVQPPAIILRQVSIVPARVSIVPARVILWVTTHVFDHKGQLAVMCRQLGSPIPVWLDFPLR